MTTQRTFSIIKPDAVERNLIGKIYSRFEQAGLKIVAAKMLHLTQEQVTGFYAEHQGKPFFEGLIQNMMKGPIMVQVLEGEDAVSRYRQLMGSTDPFQAHCGTIRADYALNMQRNSVHGSDSIDSAQREIAFFFNEDEIN